MRAFEANNIDADETWRIFFLLCLSECRDGETWIDSAFGDALQSLGELNIPNLPYRTLCRSIFDVDPAAMFLALYRCLETLYAFSGARDIIAALGLTQTWDEVAAALEDRLGWYPREEASLTNLVVYGAEQDHAAILSALGEAELSTETRSSAVARRIYRLRNNLVHFRPAQHRFEPGAIEWNRLCEAIAGLVCSIYAEVFRPILVETG